jgi:TonB family protein
MSNAADAQVTPPEEGGHDNPQFFDTQQLRALGPSEQHTELLVLSRDPALIEVIRAAAPGVVKVSHAADLDEATENLPNLDPGVLVVDMTIAGDLADMLPQLTQHFPEVVIVVAGKRDDVAALMRLTAAGRIFRFLLVPLSQGQTRLALGAAVAQHLGVKAANLRTSELPAVGASSGGNKYLMSYGALGVGLLVVVGGIWLGVRAFIEKPAPPASAPVAQQAAPANQPAAVAGKPDPVQAELALAQEAFTQGKYYEPRGDSALDFYRNALKLDPTNSAAQAGVRSVVDKILERAEQSLAAERIDEAVQGIKTARDIDATHPRLAFLDLQVSRERERLKLGQARETSERVRKLVEQASLDIAQQRFTRPPGSNAREALQQARRLDPNDKAVELGLRELGAAMTDAARKAVNAGDIAQARELIDATRRLGSPGPAVAEVERAIAEATRRPATPAANEPPQTGRTTTAPVRETPPSASGTNEPRPADTAPAAPAVAESKPPTSAVQPSSGSRDVLQAAELKRTREVAADYPAQAALDGTEGWVDIDFVISPEGVPENLKVWDASPKRVFDRAAVNALRQWRFEPIKENGVPVARRATMRIRFQRR